ncbi:beta glucosidase 46, partial [Tanacetum coccineum]
EVGIRGVFTEDWASGTRGEKCKGLSCEVEDVKGMEALYGLGEEGRLQGRTDVECARWLRVGMKGCEAYGEGMSIVVREYARCGLNEVCRKVDWSRWLEDGVDLGLFTKVNKARDLRVLQYDSLAGFYGVMKQPCLGIIPKRTQPKYLDLLAGRGLPTTKDMSYIIDIFGKVEKVKHGFGMKVPKVVPKYVVSKLRYYGDRVKYWVTLNKPYVDAAYGYRSGIYPLARCSASLGNYTSGDFKSEPYIAAHNMILSHAAVVNMYRTK